MYQPLVAFCKRVFSNRNLLFLNGLLCIAYPLCYTFLVLLPLGSEANTPGSSGNGVIVINSLFLAIIVLTVNTILTLYRQFSSPRTLIIRLVFYVLFTIWVFYALVCCIFSLFSPGFLTKLYHVVSHDFRWMDFRFFIILSVFGFGMSYLTWMYYKGTRMQQHAYYLIFTLLLFSYKLMLPHFLFISAWVFYAGYNFTIYYNIIDQSGLSRNLELNIFQGHQDGVGLIRFENDISNPH